MMHFNYNKISKYCDNIYVNNKLFKSLFCILFQYKIYVILLKSYEFVMDNKN